MLLSQVLFLINAMFLPISLLISMIPAFSGTSKRAVVSLFNTIMLRVGTTLLTTFVLMLSSIVYSAVGGMAFILVLIMQLVVFAGVYMQKERLLGMIGLQPDGAGGRMGRAIAGRSRGVLSRTMRKALPFGVGFGIGRRSGRNHTAQTTQRSSSSGTSTASRESSGAMRTRNRSRRNRQSRIWVGVWAKRSARSQIRRPALRIRQQKPHKRSRICRLMRNTLSAAMWNPRVKACAKPCRNAVKAAPHSLKPAVPQRQAAARKCRYGVNRAAAMHLQQLRSPILRRNAQRWKSRPRQSQPETHNATTGSQCSVQPPQGNTVTRPDKDNTADRTQTAGASDCG